MFPQVTLQAGVYWRAVAVQGAPATRPVLSGGNKDGKLPSIPTEADWLGNYHSIRAEGFNGQLPAQFTGAVNAVGGDAITVAVRMGTP